MSSEVLNVAAWCAVGGSILTLSVRYIIRTYFREKRAHLKAMLGADNSTNEKE